MLEHDNFQTWIDSCIWWLTNFQCHYRVEKILPLINTFTESKQFNQRCLFMQNQFLRPLLLIKPNNWKFIKTSFLLSGKFKFTNKLPFSVFLDVQKKKVKKLLGSAWIFCTIAPINLDVTLGFLFSFLHRNDFAKNDALKYSYTDKSFLIWEWKTRFKKKHQYFDSPIRVIGKFKHKKNVSQWIAPNFISWVAVTPFRVKMYLKNLWRIGSSLRFNFFLPSRSQKSSDLF